MLGVVKRTSIVVVRRPVKHVLTFKRGCVRDEVSLRARARHFVTQQRNAMIEIYLLIGIALGIGYLAVMVAATRQFDTTMVVLSAMLLFAWPIVILAAALDHT